VYGQLDPMGRMLYVAGHDGRIRAVDLVTHEITQTARMLRFATDESYLLRAVCHQMVASGICRLGFQATANRRSSRSSSSDTQAMSMASVITPVGPFSGLALSADGRRLYASQSDLHSIMVIDTETRRIRTVVVGAKPSILFVVKAP